ncbi:MAG: hypothetical protein HYY04_16545 [Chloroflexi bacterium]|nr:hypothetical protein [Chloroflexota bacterium]
MSEAIEHEGEADLVGEVRAADLDTGVFVLRLPDGEAVQARFSPEQEELITQALREHVSQRLRLRARVALSHAGGKIKRVLAVEEIALEEPPTWETLLEIGAAVPEGDWAKVPQDLARNVDHYLYGARKRDE